MLKTLAFLILFFGALTLVTLFEQDQESQEVKGEKEEQNLILAYCNDFIDSAVALAEQNDLELLRLDNSFDVLSSLKSGDIDYALIGRKAYSYEINSETLEIPLKDYGLTLVSFEPNVIEYSEIEGYEVHTYLEKEEAENFFSYQPNLVFHENIDSAVESGIALISWEDFQDDFQSVMPIENNARVEKFRTPILYMREETKPLENINL